MSIYEKQVRKFYSEIWEKKRLAEVPRVLHQDFVFRGSLGQEKQGYSGFIEYLESIHSALSDYRCLIEDLVVESETVFAKMLFSGNHQGTLLGYSSTNKQVLWAGAALFKFSGGKVSSLWVLGDLKSLELQLAS